MKVNRIFSLFLIFVFLCSSSFPTIILKPLNRIWYLLKESDVGTEVINLVKDIVLNNVEDDMYRYGMNADELLPLLDSTVVLLDGIVIDSIDDLLDPVECMKNYVEKNGHIIFEMKDEKDAFKISNILNEVVGIPALKVGKDILVGKLRSLKLVTLPSIDEDELLKVKYGELRISVKLIHNSFVKIDMNLKEQNEFEDSQIHLEELDFPLPRDFFLALTLRNDDTIFENILKRIFKGDEYNIARKLGEKYLYSRVILDSNLSVDTLVFKKLKVDKAEIGKIGKLMKELGESVKYFQFGKDHILIFGNDNATIIKCKGDERDVIERIAVLDTMKSEAYKIYNSFKDKDMFKPFEYEIIVNLNVIFDRSDGKLNKNILLIRKIDRKNLSVYFR